MTSKQLDDAIDMFRTMLDPLGYKVEKKIGSGHEWSPENSEDYENMGSNEIRKQINDFERKKKNLTNRMSKAREQVLEYLEKNGPNELTETCFTTDYKGKSNKLKNNSIDMESHTLSMVNHTLTWLRSLLKSKLEREMVEEMNDQLPDVVELEERHSPNKLVVYIDDSVASQVEE